MTKVDLLHCVTSIIVEEKSSLLREMSVSDLCDVISKCGSYTLLDVRDNDSFLTAHIVTAIHLNCSTNLMTKKSLLRLKNELDTNDKWPSVIIIYNQKNSSINSKLVTFVASLNKSDDIYTLKGGFEKFSRTVNGKYIVKRNSDNFHIPYSPTNPSEVSEDIMAATMSKITDYLYIGNERDSSDLDLLRSEKISHILCVTTNTDLHFEDQDMFIYKRIPASDSTNQDLMQFFNEGFDFIENAKQSGGRVLVHCLAGVSRSVTIVCAYLIKVGKMDVLSALEFVRGKRSIAAPNLSFIGQLDRFSKIC